MRSGGTPRSLRGPSSVKVGKRFSFDPPPGAPEVPIWEAFHVFSMFFSVCFSLVFLEGPFEAFSAPEAPREEQKGCFRVPFRRPLAGRSTL